MEFDRELFRESMAKAIDLHNQGLYEQALTLRAGAYQIAPENSDERGRAARDMSASYDRLGLFDEAEQSALEAYDIHDKLVRQTRFAQDYPARIMYRERGATAGIYVVTAGLRRIIGDIKAGREFDGESTLQYGRSAEQDFRKSRLHAHGVNSKYDQYEINAARRLSLNETIAGRNRRRGLELGARAVRLSFMSESPDLDTSNPSLTRRGRLRSKRKAFLGGVAAIGVSLLMTNKTGYRQRLALAAANKVL